MCVYKGVTGLVAKQIPEAGTKWRTYFGIAPKPIWCGWTTLEVPMHYHVAPVDWETGGQKFVDYTGATLPEALAEAWAKYVAAAWGPGGDDAGVEVSLDNWSTWYWRFDLRGRRFWANSDVEGWWATYPGIQPEKIVLNFTIQEYGPDAGGVWIPEFYVSQRMDAAHISLEFDVSGVSFPDEHWLFLVEPDPAMFNYYCYTLNNRCTKGATAAPYNYMTIDWYAGGGGWEWIDIPDWIFESPGKYWLAMVDENGVMLPGPYLPLN